MWMASMSSIVATNALSAFGRMTLCSRRWGFFYDPTNHPAGTQQIGARTQMRL